jgi:hypothetical protein
MIGIYLSHNFGFLQRKTASDTQDCSLWGARGSVTPPAFENFAFFNTKPKKITFSGLFSYSNYLEENITLPPFLKKIDS